jgi:O-acetyl-ADP-ribose deacetylase (regulator of RNase III)
MMRVKVGDILESKCQTLTNTVNCVGIMGKGIALAFKKRFPEMFADYAARCSRGEVRLGEPYLYKEAGLPWILNFPTKQHWRALASLDDIVKGLEYLEAHYRDWGVESIAVPPLGCGNGELDWRVVGPTLVQHLQKLEIPVELYAPHGTPEKLLQLSFLANEPAWSRPERIALPPVHIQPSWVIVVEALNRIQQAKYHWPTGRIVFQKLVYFLDREKVPTGLQFMKSSFGPWSRDYKLFLTRLLNNGLILEDALPHGAFLVRPGPTFEDARKAYAGDIQKWEHAIQTTVDLFVRMTSRQSEIAATVAFAASELSKTRTSPPSELEVFDYVMEWKKGRKPAWDPREVGDTIRSLSVLGSVKLEGSTNLPLRAEKPLLA